MTLRRLLPVLLIGLLVFAARGGALAQDTPPGDGGGLSVAALPGTGFTYQGGLASGGNPVNGACDFRVNLWDAVSAGAQVGGTETLANVTVTNGRFTLLLNSTGLFGARAFDGSARWLNIAVRCPTGEGSFVALAPRQALTPAPLAFALPGLRTEQNPTSPNVIGGFISNTVGAGAVGATIAGGGGPGVNQVSGNHGTVGGGTGNNASGQNATVGGGAGNFASALHATVGGGQLNVAGGLAATVAGGQLNGASDDYATVGGGLSNAASGNRATVGGGSGNTASALDATVGGGEGNTASGSRATVGGGDSNTASSSGATVGGGWNNAASEYSATVGGGDGNTASGSRATVGGGDGNTASGDWATVGGGRDNLVNDGFATVAGGHGNTASGGAATVGGGGWNGMGGFAGNTASGDASTVPGGYNNLASGDFSFAAGHNARAIHDGAFVWSHSSTSVISSTTENQFLVRANGGISLTTNDAGTVGASLAPGSGTWVSFSDRNLKEHFAPVDGVAILNTLAGIPIQTWNYTTQDDGIRHLGPMAQDFYAAFGLGEGETTIGVVDADGVALAAIQGLYTVVQEKESLLEEQRAEIAALTERVAALQSTVETSRRDVSTGAETSHRDVSTGGYGQLLLGLLLGAGIAGGAFAAGRRQR